MEKPYIVELELYEADTAVTGILYSDGDRGVYPLKIRLKSNGEPYLIPDGAVASLRFGMGGGRSSGGIASVADASGGALSYDVQAANLAAAGDALVFVSLQLGSDKVLTWQPFYIRIRALPSAGPDPPEADLPYWEQVNARISELRSLITGMVEATGDSGYVF